MNDERTIKTIEKNNNKKPENLNLTTTGQEPAFPIWVRVCKIIIVSGYFLAS
jgi:hypothetical protein